jgi:hypothetical protein
MTDLVRQEIATAATILVVKVGTRVLTDTAGRLDVGRVEQLAEQVHRVLETGRRVVLVSSGAVGAGIGRLGLQRRPTDLAHLQAVAAVGQSVLVEAYERTLYRHGHHAAQVLLTAEDLDHRTRYLNARNTILKLLEIGAVYLDGGLEPARAFIDASIGPAVREIVDNKHGQNYKSLLQQYAQKRWSVTPNYEVLDEKGPDHAKAFEVCVEINGRRFESAWGNNKKDSEQRAAKLAMEELRQQEQP